MSMWMPLYDRLKYSGLGGMVVDMSGKTLSFFSEEVDAETLDAIMAKGAEDCHPRT